MKTRMLRRLARVALSLVAIAAWGTGATAQSLSGVYGGEGCSFKLTFRAKDVVYIQFIAGGEVQTEMPGQYKVDGDKVSVTAASWGLVFTRKGDALEARYLGGPEVCTKQTGVSSARPQVARTPIPSSCDKYDWAYNRDNSCFDTRPIPLTPTSKAKGSSGDYSWPPQSQGAVVLPAPADASVMPRTLLLVIKVSRDGRTLQARPYYGSNIQTFDAAAVAMAKNIRWRPAQRQGEAVEAWVPLEFQAVIAGPTGFISVNVIGGGQIHNTVRIDRVFIGNPPVINYQVRAGPHTINVQITGPPYREVNDTVQVASGATVVKSYAADPLAPAPLPPKPKPIDEQQLVAAMKSDLRWLVTAEEGFFADSVRYTAKVDRLGAKLSELGFRLSGGNTAPQVTLTNDGWSAIIGNPRTPTVCVIFVGSTPRPPATREGAPECQ